MEEAIKKFWSVWAWTRFCEDINFRKFSRKLFFSCMFACAFPNLYIYQKNHQILKIPFSTPLISMYIITWLRLWGIILLTEGAIHEIFTKKYWELSILKNSVFLSQPFWIFFFQRKKNFFASFPWKSVKVSWAARMGRNFDDYPSLQQKSKCA